MDKNEITEIFKKTGAVLNGHFELSSGLHSDTYIQCAKVLEYPNFSEKLCAHLVSFWKSQKIDVVAGPAYGGILVSYELARQLKCRSVYLERVQDQLLLRRQFRIAEGENVLVAEDVITTGDSVKQVLQVVKSSGGNIAGVAAFADRSKGKIFDEKFQALIRLNPPTYKADSCPLCSDGVPFMKPGSRAKI